MDNLTILAIVLTFSVAVAVLLMSMPKSENKTDGSDLSDVSDVPVTELRSLIEKLSRRLEDAERRDKLLNEKISNLQLTSAIDREQAKYLTANVNRTIG
tara:strand:- start:1613 stop:1909 length:297 start_codon:yes stop_codon:yes gene_type:complete